MISSEDGGQSLDDRIAADEVALKYGVAGLKDGVAGLKEGLGFVDLLLGSLQWQVQEWTVAQNVLLAVVTVL